MMICANPDCPHNGRPQANSNYYKKKRQCRTCLRMKANVWAAHNKEFRTNSPFEIDRERRMRLPIEPFRQWLLTMEASSPSTDRQGVLAARLDISERRLWSWTRDKRQHTVDLDLLDRAICAWGDPRILRDLYPELYVTCDQCGLTGLHTNACPTMKPTRAEQVAA